MNECLGLRQRTGQFKYTLFELPWQISPGSGNQHPKCHRVRWIRDVIDEDTDSEPQELKACPDEHHALLLLAQHDVREQYRHGGHRCAEQPE
jgi:hypothetical protein